MIPWVLVRSSLLVRGQSKFVAILFAGVVAPVLLVGPWLGGDTGRCDVIR